MQLCVGSWELALPFTGGETEAGRWEVTHEGPHSQAELGQRWEQDPGLPAPHPSGLSVSKYGGLNQLVPEPRRPPVWPGWGRRCFGDLTITGKSKAGTPWDLTLTYNSWFPGRIALGRAAQPTAKTLVFIANKGQARPRKSCCFLRHAGSSSLGSWSLRSPRGISMRAPLFHIR